MTPLGLVKPRDKIYEEGNKTLLQTKYESSGADGFEKKIIYILFIESIRELMMPGDVPLLAPGA